jgi:hypothetical protein
MQKKCNSIIRNMDQIKDIEIQKRIKSQVCKNIVRNEHGCQSGHPRCSSCYDDLLVGTLVGHCVDLVGD